MDRELCSRQTGISEEPADLGKLWDWLNQEADSGAILKVVACSVLEM